MRRVLFGHCRLSHRNFGRFFLTLGFFVGVLTTFTAESQETTPAGKESGKTAAVHLALPRCPETHGDLLNYRTSLARISTPIEAAHVRQSLIDCFSKRGIDIPACLGDIARAVAAPGDFDAQLARVRNELRLPEVFYQDGRIRVPPHMTEIARQNGWPTVSFKTRGDGGFDPNSDHLQIVVIPGASLRPPSATDWYVQWSIQSVGEEDYHNPLPYGRQPTQGTFAAIAMHRQADGRTYTPFFYLAADGDTSLSAKEPSSCLHCHQNGLRELSPRGYIRRAGDPQRMNREQASAVDAINRSMARYAQSGNRIDFGITAQGMPGVRYNPHDVGAVMGSTDDVSFWQRQWQSLRGTRETRSREFILGANGQSGCAFATRRHEYVAALDRSQNNRTYEMSAQPQINWQRVAAAMGSCVSCHDGNRRTALTATNLSERGLITKILQDASMPARGHRFDLNQDERIALVNCIGAETAAIEARWLMRLIEVNNRCGFGIAADNCGVPLLPRTGVEHPAQNILNATPLR